MTDTDRQLRVAAGIFLAGFVLHNVDHGRRGIDVITDHVVWAGTVVAIVAAVVLTLIFTRHPFAPTAAAAAGFGIAFGVTASHLLPEWSAFSDPLASGDTDPLTWVAVLSEIGGAAVMGAAGWRAMRVQHPVATT